MSITREVRVLPGPPGVVESLVVSSGQVEGEGETGDLLSDRRQASCPSNPSHRYTRRRSPGDVMVLHCGQSFLAP